MTCQTGIARLSPSLAVGMSKSPVKSPVRAEAEQGRGLVLVPIRRPLLVDRERHCRLNRAVSAAPDNGSGMICHPSSVVEHSLGKGEVVGSNPMGGLESGIRFPSVWKSG